MESLDLHPEELFDKADAGLADAQELARLEAHLEACATCRFERQVRADFAAVTATPAELDHLVARALHVPVDEATPRRRRSLTPWLIAAALASGLSFAAVAQFTGLLPRLLETRAEPTLAPVTPPPAPRSRAVEPEPVIEEVTAPPPPPVVLAPTPAPVRTRVSKPVSDPPPAPETAVVVPDAATLFSLAHAARIEGRRADAVAQLR